MHHLDLDGLHLRNRSVHPVSLRFKQKYCQVRGRPHHIATLQYSLLRRHREHNPIRRPNPSMFHYLPPSGRTRHRPRVLLPQRLELLHVQIKQLTHVLYRGPIRSILLDLLRLRIPSSAMANRHLKAPFLRLPRHLRRVRLRPCLPCRCRAIIMMVWIGVIRSLVAPQRVLSFLDNIRLAHSVQRDSMIPRGLIQLMRMTRNYSVEDASEILLFQQLQRLVQGGRSTSSPHTFNK